MARGRRPDSSTPDDPADQPATVGEGSELVDPLQVASAGLEDVQEDGTSRVSNAFDPEPGTPDPLAVLSRAIDEGLGTHWDEPDPPKRGILGRLGRGRPALVPSSSEAASPADPVPSAADESGVTTAQAAVQSAPEPAADPLREEPRVTTWAEDFEVASATGEWPAVGSDDEPPPVGGGEPDPPAASGPTESPRRRGGRRRRRRDEPASVHPDVEPAVDPADVEDEAVEEQALLSEDAAVGQPDDADAERARLVAVRAAAQRDEEDRLAVLKEQEDLRRAEQAEAERLEAERAAAEEAEVERLERLEHDAASAEEHRLAAERAEAERIDADRVAAQRAEDDRLEGLRAGAEQAERDRLDGIRAAAEQAERERLEARRAEESRVERARQEAEAATAQAAVQQAAAEQAATEQAATQRLEQDRLEQDRLAAEKAEAARAERERQASVMAERSAADKTPARPGVAAPTRARSDETGATEQIPRFIEFRSTSVLRYLFGAFFVVFAVAAVIAIFRAVSEGDRGVVLAAAGLTALAMLSWWALLSWAPPIVSISDGVLEIARGTTTTSWDLRAPATEITFRGRRSSRSWRALLRGPGGKPVTISARQVDPAQFVEVVEHYQSVGTGTPE